MSTLDALIEGPIVDHLEGVHVEEQTEVTSTDDGLSDQMEGIVDAVQTLDDVNEGLTAMIGVANESIGMANEEAIARALSVGFDALLRSHQMQSLRTHKNMPAMESQQHKLNDLAIAMEQAKLQLLIANEAFFEDVIKWFDTIGESTHNKMVSISQEASVLLNQVKGLDNRKPNATTFTPSYASDLSVAGDTSPAAILKGYTNTISLIKHLNEEFPALFRQLCSEVISLYKSTSSLTTGVASTIGVLGVGFFWGSIIAAVLFGGLAGVAVAGVRVAVASTIGDVVDGAIRWLIEKIPNERRNTMKREIDAAKGKMASAFEQYFADFGKSAVNGNRNFVVETEGKKPLLVLSRDDAAAVRHGFKVPSKQEMIAILETVIESTQHYTSSGKATAKVNSIILETEKDLGMDGSKHHLTADALNYHKQAVRHASTSLYFKTEGLYRKPMSELSKHQVRSAKALVAYVREALRHYH